MHRGAIVRPDLVRNPLPDHVRVSQRIDNLLRDKRIAENPVHRQHGVMKAVEANKCRNIGQHAVQ